MTKAGSKLKNKQDLVKNTSPNTAKTRSKGWEETFDAVTDIIALISPDYEDPGVSIQRKLSKIDNTVLNSGRRSFRSFLRPLRHIL